MENKDIRRTEWGDGRKGVMSLAWFPAMFGSEADVHFALYHIHQPYCEVP